MSAGAINRLVALLRGHATRDRGACYLVESGPDQFQLFEPSRRGPVHWGPAAGPDVRSTTLEQALQLYLVEIEPVDWAEAPAGLLDTFQLPVRAIRPLRLKTIRPYGVAARVSA